METRIIVNPSAGSAGDLEAVKEALAGRPGTELCFSEKEGDAEELAREAVRRGLRTVVAAGGDGTLNEVLNGLADNFAGVRLGLLPLGTGNDFARSIGVPADLGAALAVLDAGRTLKIDVAQATFQDGRRYFLNMSAGGFSSVVSEKAHEAKDRWGPLAYMRGAVDALPELEAFEATLTLSGAETIRLEIYNLVISNGRYVAAGIPVAPQAKLDDGLLDVMIAPATTIPNLALLLPKVLLGRHLDSDLLLFRKATRIEIDSTPPMTFNVDGEILNQEPALFEVLPRALEMVVGEMEDGSAAAAGPDPARVPFRRREIRTFLHDG
jgi:diacylglycerol kinase (ATP)